MWVITFNRYDSQLIKKGVWCGYHFLKGYKARILSGEVTLEELAETESDCSSAKQGGDLGFFTRGKMQSKYYVAIVAGG